MRRDGDGSAVIASGEFKAGGRATGAPPRRRSAVIAGGESEAGGGARGGSDGPSNKHDVINLRYRQRFE